MATLRLRYDIRECNFLWMILFNSLLAITQLASEASSKRKDLSKRIQEESMVLSGFALDKVKDFSCEMLVQLGDGILPPESFAGRWPCCAFQLVEE